MKKFRIDWPNHIIGFFSALFGIMIAFELEDFRKQRDEQSLAKSAFENLKKEVEINKNILHESVNGNLESIHTIQQLLKKVDNDFQFKGTHSQADSINQKWGNLLYIDTSDSVKRQLSWPTHFGMQNISIPSIQTTAWESAKATGSLNVMSYEKVASLTFVYSNAKISDELTELRRLWRNSDKAVTKSEFLLILSEMEKDHEVIGRELNEFDQFVNMLQAME
jgi:hypothetical protein